MQKVKEINAINRLNDHLLNWERKTKLLKKVHVTKVNKQDFTKVRFSYCAITYSELRVHQLHNQPQLSDDFFFFYFLSKKMFRIRRTEESNFVVQNDMKASVRDVFLSKNSKSNNSVELNFSKSLAFNWEVVYYELPVDVLFPALDSTRSGCYHCRH